jgi:hypothetical protein
MALQYNHGLIIPGKPRNMTFVSLLTTPVRRPLSILDWMGSIAICYVCILTFAIFLDGFSAGAFGQASFMMLLGFIGPFIGLAGSDYAPMLVPVFIILSVIWGAMFYALMRFALRRFLQVSIITVFFMTFLVSGIFGIACTAVI